MAAAWRLIDDLRRPVHAAGQMAADVALLDEVIGGAPPALRWYRWPEPALSLGRFQPASDVDEEACRSRGVDVVRRPTGGRALLHGSDLTYSVVMARPAGPAGAIDAVYGWIAAGLAAGLGRLGLVAEVAHHEGATAAACFSSLRGSDLRVGGAKLVGSAQVHREGAILQHGSVLVHRLDFDETDVLAIPPARRDAERRRLRASTVTLDELGVEAGADEVAAALTWGFATALDLDFTSRPRVAGTETGFVAAVRDPR